MRVTVVFKAVTRNWLRSRSGLFFSFIFPVFFLLIFGSIVGGSGGAMPVAVQNNDVVNSTHTPLSVSFVAALNSTQVVKVSQLDSSVNVSSFIVQQASSFSGDPRVLIIPEGFSDNLTHGIPARLVYFSSPGDPLSPRVGGVISSVANAFNSQILSEPQLLTVSSQSSSTHALTQVDYYMPGLIAAFMMANGVIGLTNTATEFRRTGLTKRLSATPLSKLEWMVGNVLSQALLAFVLATVMILLGFVVYGTSATISAYVVLGIISGAILFSGIGMTLAGLVKDTEAAAGLANAISFPMMFLSGTFFPISIMPSWLQTVAAALPLTYFSQGLRDSMVVGDLSGALFNIGVTGALAIAFTLLGARATRWREG